ncbi:endochitinase 1 [Aspergillus avenaceus]|uniref:chitinase n=1 Tax=Aspergillus avenaceus TaxID=36643 RepID=A0A5N6TME3_ASPAV|nr:endochitinase 1 [Aspergillus avenaceus]
MLAFIFLLSNLLWLAHAAIIPRGNETTAKPNPGYISMAYYASWTVYSDHHPQDIPAKSLTHILYSFANITETGEVYFTEPDLHYQKRYPGDSISDDKNNVYGCIKHLKVLLSIGGYTYSQGWDKILKEEKHRKTFATSAVDLMQNIGYDGIDIDWEFPTTNSSVADMVKLLKGVREELDKYHRENAGGERFLLTIACSAGPLNYKPLNIPEIDKYLDYWNIMAYDYVGTWSKIVGHGSNLYPSKSDPLTTPVSSEEAVKYYIDQGVAPKKIIFGMPIYGRAFNTTGLGGNFTSVGIGSHEDGVWDYKVLPLSGTAKVTELLDIGAAYSYDPTHKMFITYDTVNVTKVKAEYIKKRGLGGGMWWETSGDRRREGSLITTLVQSLGGQKALEATDNHMHFPKSKYDNVRNGWNK